MLIEALRAESQAKSDFISTVSHELRNSVTLISGFAAMLADSRESLSPEDFDKVLDRMRWQSERLTRLIIDLLDLSRMEAGEFDISVGPVDVAKAVSTAVASAPAPADRTVSIDVDGVAPVAADPARLEQVLVNLLGNAYRYGGPALRIEAHERPDGVVVSVADDGPGVLEDLVPRLFQRFRKGRAANKRGGVGLGLAIARGFVDAMGGRIWYEPNEPGGARFSVLLRRASEGEPPDRPDARGKTQEVGA